MEDESDRLTAPEKSIQLPSNIVMPEFGEVNVRGTGDETFVEFTILMEPQGKYAEGWRTGIALDASASMKRSYGRKVSGRVDPAVLTKYMKKGLLKSYIEDGEPIRCLQKEAYEEIKQKGYVFKTTPNILQPLAQEFTSYLANSLDGVGRTALIYWGCGKGDETQAIGEFNAADCRNLSITGPRDIKLGNATKLMPAIAYFTEQYPDAKRGLYLFITDGRIDDLEEVKQYTLQLAHDITSGKRNFVKFILIGVGDGIDRYQLQELDDFDTGTSIDIWDYKVANEMQSLVQIFSEVVGEQQIVADRGAIYSPQGECVKLYADGLPAQASFSMPAGSEWFELEVSGKRIRQTIVVDESMAIVPLPKQTDIDSSNRFGFGKLGCTGLMASFLLLGGAIAYAVVNFYSSPNLGINSSKNPDSKPNTEMLSGQDRGVASSSPTDLSSHQATSKPSTPNSGSLGQSSDRGVVSPSAKATQPSQNSTSTTIAKVPNDGDAALKPSPSTQGTTSGSSPNVGSDRTSNQSSDKNNIPNQRHKSITPPPPNASSNASGNQGAKSPVTGGDSSNPSDRNFSALVPDTQVIIYFPVNESSLTAAEFTKLNEFWSKIKNKKGVISVKGYTDSYGENTYNLGLSNARANEVIDQLRSMGLTENYKLTLEALGDLNPIKDNNTDTGRAFNRRVVVSFKAS
ncbi:OmpA family protein [Tumidithrix elongata RA019]|uniref:OmpA family protein n=1 Tax=Tumidithrix elongata BACA0141 TaxID=2716417 RepID=A0AAW9Q0T1_9CYAN|nr:OmpA family protein [Tumidithrix elongata RA019]